VAISDLSDVEVLSYETNVSRILLPWSSQGLRNCGTPVHEDTDMSQPVAHTFLVLNMTALALSEERRLRVFENKVLRRIFGPKKDEVTRE
jgi:hypothetical protein